MQPTRLLWAMSSVGYCHLMRDLPVIGRLQDAGCQVDILAPPPLKTASIDPRFRFLDDARALRSSGSNYRRAFERHTDVFDLREFIEEDAKWFEHDCLITRRVLDRCKYDLIVGDEAFWMLAGFAQRWLQKPAPFVYMTEHVGLKAMVPTRSNRRFFRRKNAELLAAITRCTDAMIYFGELDDVPDERFASWLPNQRKWLSANGQASPFVMDFETSLKCIDKPSARSALNLSQNTPFYLGVISFVSPGFRKRFHELMCGAFNLLRQRTPEAMFAIINPDQDEFETPQFIKRYGYLDNFWLWSLAADCVVTQSGLGKIVGLSQLGVPFVSIPPDHHFESEYLSAIKMHRRNCGGHQVLLRESTAETLCATMLDVMRRRDDVVPIANDNGTKCAELILTTLQRTNRRILRRLAGATYFSILSRF